MPAELKLVELFGYTLGGFYLARYEDSPVGAFDEVRRRRKRRRATTNSGRGAHTRTLSAVPTQTHTLPLFQLPTT